MSVGIDFQQWSIRNVVREVNIPPDGDGGETVRPLSMAISVLSSD